MVGLKTLMAKKDIAEGLGVLTIRSLGGGRERGDPGAKTTTPNRTEESGEAAILWPQKPGKAVNWAGGSLFAEKVGQEEKNDKRNYH